MALSFRLSSRWWLCDADADAGGTFMCMHGDVHATLTSMVGSAREAPGGGGTKPESPLGKFSSSPRASETRTSPNPLALKVIPLFLLTMRITCYHRVIKTN